MTIHRPGQRRPGKRTVAVALAAASIAFPLAAPSAADPNGIAAREAEPVVLTGHQVPTWSRLPAVGVANPQPGPLVTVRDAHNGTVVAPPDVRTGVPVEEIAAYRWEDGWVEVPVQVDERYPYFLANANSDFSFYSGTDYELTYAWDDESWKKTAGECFTEYAPGDGPTPDPVPTLDDDDEIAFMASDAGAQAPGNALQPSGTGPVGTGTTRQEITLIDPTNPATIRYVYLFRKDEGSSFDESSGYVRYERDANADEWIDRNSFSDADPEKLGSSNTGYGPNLSGTVCNDDPDTAEVEALRNSTDRFPRDGVRVTTDSYEWYASGRWMVRSLRVAKPGEPGLYGPDLIDRWKGRAFQQSPDSSISLVGFEDEQVNWEANSTLLGELAGPVRAIRETWGADSGTNVTKTETFYRDAIAYRYHLRVHPIPPDGIYTNWDYNAGVVTRYYNAIKPGGVDVDGANDDVGNVDVNPLTGEPTFFDAPDPTFNIPSAFNSWEQVSGDGDVGSLVYVWEVKGPTSVEQPLAFPYYRDDACLDDGTGDSPVPRPWPGEPSTDQRVKDGYATLAGKPYEEVTCDEKQGAWGSHGLHVFFTGDTDNAFSPVVATEADVQQWQYTVPTAAPAPVGQPYLLSVTAKLVPVAIEQPSTPGPDEEPLVATRMHLSVPPRRDWQGPTGTMTATLTERETGAPIAGRPVSFYVDGELVEESQTDANGVATAPTRPGFDDDTVVRAEFAGDDTYEPISVEGTYHPGQGLEADSGP